MENNQEQLLQIDMTHLTNAVRKASGQAGIVIQDWHSKKINTGYDLNHTIYRCYGSAVDQGQVFPWSLILKIVHANEKNLSPRDSSYWKREFLAYQTGFLTHLPTGLSAPVCYVAVEQSDDSIWLFLEEIKDDADHAWQMEAYGHAAFQLGRFNAAYLTGTPLPMEDWLPEDWLRKYLDRAAASIDFMRMNPDHAVVKTVFGGKLPILLAVWDIREMLLARLDRHPKTFCHQDAFLNNLFLRQGALIAIDWSYAGVAPLGAELAAFLPVSLAVSKIPGDEFLEFERLCVQSYRNGLAAAGFRAKKRDIRRAYVLTFLLRYFVAASAGEIFPYLLEQFNKGEFTELPLPDPQTKNSKKDSFYGRIFIEALGLMGFRPAVKMILGSIRYRVNLH